MKKKMISGVLAAAICFFSATERAADTTETFDVGVSDFELYTGFDATR